MSYILDQDVVVLDNKDGKKYPAKIVNVDSEKEEVKIHYVDWHTRFDEVLPFNSNRISLPSAMAAQDRSEVVDDDIKAALGKLAGIDEVTAKVVPNFSPCQSLPVNKTKN